MRKPLRLAVLVLAISLALAGIAATTAGAADTGTIKGNVKYDGVGLAHVSVFLRDPALGPQHACTNSKGFYKFTNVTAGDNIIMATGPGDCLNRYFLTPDGEQLMVQQYDRNNGVAGPDQWDNITLGAGETLKVTFRPKLAKGPTCGGYKPTIKGTSGDDVLNGTSGIDVIVGRGGNDQIFGRGGDDFICGDGGNDILEGNGGRDFFIYGGNGRDVLRGGGQDDFLDGGPNKKDVLKGGNGFDTCFDPDGWKNAVCEVGP